MNEYLKEQCALEKAAAVLGQQKWKRINNWTLPRESSRHRRKHRQRPRFKERKEKHGNQEEESSSEENFSTCNHVPFAINERLKCIGFNKRRPSFSDSESVLDIFKMPVGTTNSILKSSFSMTSLRSSTPTDTPEHGSPVKLKTERQYHSLTKNNRKSSEHDRQLWRKSWGSGISQDGKEFWEGFQADYDYLMAQNILDRDTAEVPSENGSGSTPTAPLVWSHSEFMDHFAQLYSWLRGIQDSVYGKPENVTDWKLRAERQEEMQRQKFRLENFNEESKKIISRFPELKDEVSWLVKHINDKWDTVETMMGVLKKVDNNNDRKCQMGSREKVRHEVKCLRKWLRELDTKLKPLSFQCGWTKAELEIKTKEHMVLHRDIEAHGKIVSSVCKLCEKADSSSLLAAQALERKYHEYYLRSLEWQFHIESLIGGQLNKSSSNLSNDSDGEPVAKIARITNNGDPENGYEGEDSDNYEPLKSDDETLKENDWSMDTSSLVTKEPQSSLEELSSTTMVGGSTEKPEGIKSSESTQDDSKASTVGTKSKNANISFSCANRKSESRSNRAEKSPSSTCDALIETPSNGLNENELSRIKETNTAEGRQTNRSTKKLPNTGTFTWKHLDTDSDQEKVIMSERSEKEKRNSLEKDNVDGKDVETTSSEDSWTYMSGRQTEKSEAGVERKPSAAVRLDFNEGDVSKGDSNVKEMKHFSAKNIPRSNSVNMEKNKEPISSSNRKLVDRADELVRCKVKSWKTRSARSKKGRKEEDGMKPLDSCDASEEYTTEDSDEKGIQSSEDNEGSVATCRKFGSDEGILDDTPSAARASFECVARRQKHALRNRPWSMSSVSWLRSPKTPNLKSRSSMPELALNQRMECWEKERAREFYVNTCKSSRGFWVETNHASGNGGSSRRKRTKMRKRINKKSDSGSDAITLSGSDSPNTSPSKQIHAGALVKSGSFSGVVRRQRDFSPSFNKCDSRSGTETDEEPTRLNPPMFRLGSKDGAVTVTTEPEKGHVEEQLSLNSDQVYWDPYQEKYQSEAYSEEPPDSDTAKKLLEFGEDYGKFLGNQSDCASGWNRSIAARNRKKFDSDSDVDEVKKFLRRSVEQLDLSENKFNKTVTDLISTSSLKADEFSLKSFFDEIIATCKGNVDCLTKLLEEVKDEVLLSKEHKDIQNVKESWENLKATAESHKAKELQKEMILLKEEFLNLAGAVESMEMRVTSREELEAKILQVKNELNSLREGKTRLLQANVSVHRFLSTAKHPELSLRDEVTELYQVWDQTFCRVSSQLSNLQSLSDAWYVFEDHLSQLQCALRTDTLKVLDFALKCGSPSPDVAVSFRDIASLLSEKESTSKSSVAIKDEGVAGDKIASPLLAALSTEGSLSDSGISDSGSEQEMSEREKRLAQLKKLAKRLESILAPGSQALSNMFNRIEQTEAELRELQKTCRDLIVRSASADEFKMIIANTASLGLPEMESSTRGISKSSSGKREKNPGPGKKSSGKGVKKLVATTGEEEKEEEGEEEEDIEECDECGGGGGGKPGRKSWLWRLIQFSLPFQLALVALLCAACIMEPRCCDSLNNLDMSLNPQLRYDSGPPPV